MRAYFALLLRALATKLDPWEPLTDNEPRSRGLYRTASSPLDADTSTLPVLNLKPTHIGRAKHRKARA